MKDYNYCCSKDGHGLSFPSFSVVFIQTFSIHRNLEFTLPIKCVREDYDKIVGEIEAKAAESKIFKSVAEYLGEPIVYMNQNIEREIFVMSGEEDHLVQKKLCGDRWLKKSIFPKTPILTKRYMKSLPRIGTVPETSRVWRFPKKAVYRFSLRGFDFSMPLRPTDEQDLYPVDLHGHVNVEMSLFFGNTVSLTYRFFFDGNTAHISAPADKSKSVDANVDHIITLLSTYLGAEYWSADSEDGPTNINLKSTFIAEKFWIDNDGNEVAEEKGRETLSMDKGGRAFDEIALRYKKYLYNNYTSYREGLDFEEMRDHEQFRLKHGVSVINDHHYAMVDIWEDVKHIVESENGSKIDLFSTECSPKLSEAEIVNHIRTHHKPELIGLMSLYPGEWPYRDSHAYDEVCGENIAIDSDDHVMVGSNMAVVIGTYGRRSNRVTEENILEHADHGPTIRKQGVNWQKHLKERARYHVSWPEYLMILQIVIAKKYVIGFAKDQMIDVALNVRDKDAEELIANNADLGMRLSRQIIQLDMVKYSKFASHKIMFDRTTRRLGLDDDLDKLKDVTEMVDNSLRNLSDYRAMRSDFLLNFILVIVSVSSTFELLFQDLKMDFLDKVGIHSDLTKIAAWLILIVASTTIFALLLVVKRSIKKVCNMFIKDN